MYLVSVCPLHKPSLSREQETTFPLPSSLGGNAIFDVRVGKMPVVLWLLLRALFPCSAFCICLLESVMLNHVKP